MSPASQISSSRRHPRRLRTASVGGSALRRILFCLALVGWLAAGPLGWAQPDEPTADGETSDGETSDGGRDSADAPDAAAGKVVFGKIDGDITLAESAFVMRLLEQARLQEAEIVALELNTFGGRVDAAVAIRDSLMDAPQETVVFINKRAISAGALISLACDKIAMSPGGTLGAATPITMSPGQELAAPVEEKYLSYFRQEMRSTAETQGRNGDIAEAMVDADFEIEGLVEKGKLLTLTTTSALANDMADVEASDVGDALRKLGYTGQVADVGRSWSEQLVAFLTSQAIASLLFMAMMILGYMEWQTPGFGVFGGIAIGCFLLLYFSHYMVNLAGYEELIFFGVGVLLMVVEMFFIPGVGVAGILGGLCVLVSMVMLLSAGDWSDLSFDNPITQDAVNQVGVVLALAVVAILALIRVLPQTRFGGGIMLESEMAATGGYTSHDATVPGLVGQVGVALSELRPSGKARIAGNRVLVETEGDFLEPGTQVEVVRQVEGRVVVRKAKAAEDEI